MTASTLQEDAKQSVKKSRTLRAISGLAVLILGVAGGVVLDRTLFTPDVLEELSSSEICDGAVTSDVSAVTRNLGSSAQVTSTWVDHRTDSSLRESCWISAGESGSLLLTAYLEKGSVADWKGGLEKQGIKNFSDQLVFAAGSAGISWDEYAAVYVPCSLSEYKPVMDDGTPVDTYIAILVSGNNADLDGNGQHRQDLAYLASRLADHSHSVMGCEEALDIPEGAPSLKKSA